MSSDYVSVVHNTRYIVIEPLELEVSLVSNINVSHTRYKKWTVKLRYCDLTKEVRELKYDNSKMATPLGLS